MRKKSNPPPPTGLKKPPPPPPPPGDGGGDDGKVVDFKPGAEMLPRRKKKPHCQHMKVLVCEQTRMLECQHCGAQVEPFDYLWRWANRRLNFHRTEVSLISERKQLRSEIAELKRHERNTKGRLKRAEGKLGGKWVRLTRKTPDGKALYMCRHCGVISAAQSKTCWGLTKLPQCNLGGV